MPTVEISEAVFQWLKQKAASEEAKLADDGLPYSADQLAEDIISAAIPADVWKTIVEAEHARMRRDDIPF